MSKLLEALKRKYKTPGDAVKALGLDEHLLSNEVSATSRADDEVLDKNPFINKESAMKMTKFGKAIFAALCAASPVLAADSAVMALVSNANRKNLDKAGIVAKLIALDANMDPEKLGNMLDTMSDAQDDPKPTVIPPQDEPNANPVDSAKALLAGKVDDETLQAILALISPVITGDSDDEPDDKMSKEDVKAAMDGLRVELREAENARRDVQPVVGDVMGLDSAAEIYGFALDHMKIDHKGIGDVNALRTIYKVASANVSVEKATPKLIAQDAADALAMFPAAKRFRGV